MKIKEGLCAEDHKVCCDEMKGNGEMFSSHGHFRSLNEKIVCKRLRRRVLLFVFSLLSFYLFKGKWGKISENATSKEKSCKKNCAHLSFSMKQQIWWHFVKYLVHKAFNFLCLISLSNSRNTKMHVNMCWWHTLTQSCAVSLNTFRLVSFSATRL